MERIFGMRVEITGRFKTRLRVGFAIIHNQGGKEWLSSDDVRILNF